MDKSMLKYIGKRLLISAITLFVILFVLFLMTRLMPGSPFNSEKLSRDQIAILNAKYGLDKPVIIQFFAYLSNMIKGDFGVSYQLYPDQSVAELVMDRAKISFIYGIAATLFGTIVGMALGIFAALKRNTIWDTIATVISVLGVSIPSFVFALLMVILFGVNLQWAPVAYNEAQPITSSVLPVLALSMSVIANVARFTRTEMISVLGSEYITLAMAKGLDQKTLILRHALRNALIPVITILGPILVNLMTGTMVVEQICGVPGLGTILINSIHANDYNIIMACSFLYAAMYILIVLAIDVSYGFIDPRIRLGKGE
ncbi:ABC transporter permease [Eggerthia catenaformis]|uniref:ABC transporter permease n=1 Tax=Eggerthia catenaformis TaxID=31973 RepID=UPI0028EE7D0A|nr:ABC transporter permease [Eggerthia catenaformis]